MKLTTAILGALASVASAHSDPGAGHVPKLMGGRKFLSELKARNALPEIFAEPAAQIKREPVGSLEQRQNVDGQCGGSFGSCAPGICCSPAGWCGTTIEYCAAPDCQLAYGPGCDGNKIPAGSSTAGVARPLLGSVEYGGVGIYDCVTAGDVAFTFDDGPYIYTSALLDKLKVYGAKATFFITGNNLGKGPIDSTPTWNTLIKRMVAEGHQIASHTWSHQSLTAVDATTFQNQMVYNEMAFRNILGYFPTYMRPPYSQCDAACSAKLKTLGYHVTYFDLDTAGYLNTSPQTIQNSKNIWDAAINPSNPATTSFLEIEHDIHDQVVNNLTDYILASMYSHGFKSVTVGECLGDPIANWYRTAGGAGASSVAPTNTASSTRSSTSSAATSTGSSPPKTISVDGSCSSTVTCQGSVFGNCCSQYGFCGSTIDYCGTGCQPASGTCGLSSSSSTSSVPLISSDTSVFSAASSTVELLSSSVYSTSSSTPLVSVVTTSILPSFSYTIPLSSSSTLTAEISTTTTLQSSESSLVSIQSSTSAFSSILSSLQVESLSAVPTFSFLTSTTSTTSSVYISTPSPMSSLVSVVTSASSLISSPLSSKSTSISSSKVSTSSSSSKSSSVLATKITSSLSSSSSASFSSTKSSSTSSSVKPTSVSSSKTSLTPSTSKSASVSSSKSSSLLGSSISTSRSSTKSSISSRSTSVSSIISSSSSSSKATSVSSTKASSSSSSSSSTKISTSSSSIKATSTSSQAASTSAAPKPKSTDGTCGTAFTCQGSVYGNCCSQYGWCGKTAAYCSAANGCQPAFGTCTGSSSSSSRSLTLSSKSSSSSSITTSKLPTKVVSTPTPTPTKLTVSTDGTCGAASGHFCIGSRFGNCCSAGGRCGNLIISLNQPFCGVGCQKAYGTCL